MYVIGLTGEIATGKTTVGGMLAERGAAVLDGDQLVHDRYATDRALVARIAARFGQEVLAADGGLDRTALGHTVFADATALRALEALVHPAVVAGMQDWLAQRRRAGGGVAVLDAVKLVEADAAGLVDELWIVTAPPGVQRQRLSQRGLSPPEAAARLAAQHPWTDKARTFLAQAPPRPVVLLANGGSLADLERQVTRLCPEHRSRGQSCPDE